MPKTRIPKSEIRNKLEIRIQKRSKSGLAAKFEACCLLGSRLCQISDFGPRAASTQQWRRSYPNEVLSGRGNGSSRRGEDTAPYLQKSLLLLEMHRKVNMALLIAVGVACVAGCKSEQITERHSPSVAVLDLENRTVNPFEEQEAKAIVFLFVRTDCPISNRYAPEIERLAARYANEGVAFWLVYPEASTSSKEIEQHRKDYHLSVRALRDPRHELVKMARVNVTPEAAVFSPNGREIYRGRIDDRYVDFGKERPAPTTHELDEALSNVIAGKPSASSATRAIGCYIE